MKPKELEKSRVDKEPYLVWNAFIELIVNKPNALSNIQAIAHFAFWYDSEVQNGGHLQYFENMFNRYRDKEDNLVSVTLEALKIIGAKKQSEILSQAAKQYFSTKRKHPSTIKEFVEFDKLYYGCSPVMNSYLERYLQTHLSEFITLIYI